jgi:glycosyltransferase involved in cell wall biosynthesis
MKNFILLSTLFYTSLSIADPLLVAVLMIKNEAPVIKKTLQPLIDSGIKDFFIYDTGSTDNTLEIAENTFKENNIRSFVIAQEPWINFAASRNRALTLTQEHFTDASFMLMLDAEWQLQNGADLLEFCKENQYNDIPIFYLHYMGFNTDFCVARLIRTHQGIHFVGKIHEIPNIVPNHTLPEHICFHASPTPYGKEKSVKRWRRDCEILLEEIKNNPGDTRSIFYLAQTYFCLGEYEEAAKWYDLRLSMSLEGEEAFVAVFVLAQVYSLMGGHDEKVIYNYLRSYSMRPTRADPLIRIAEYYWHKKAYHLCYLFARESVNIAYPKDDWSLVEKYLYDFLRYDLLGKTAILYGQYELGRLAVLKAMEARPDLEYLKDNLKIYEDILAEQ